jgi:hypothetical protein
MADIDKYNLKDTTNVYFDTGKWQLSPKAQSDLCAAATEANAMDNALLLVVGFDFKQNDPELYSVALAKEAIWTVMTANLIMMLIRRKKAEKAFYLQQNDLLVKNLTLITKYMLPLNIMLGLVAIYLGVVLRGF